MTLASRLSAEQLRELARRLRYLSLALAGSGLALAGLYLSIMISTGNWGVVFLLIGNVLIFITALSNIYDISRGELTNNWRTVVVVQVIYLLSSFFVSGLGIPLGLISALFTLAMMAQMPTHIDTRAASIPGWVPYSALISGLATYFLDIYWPLQRFAFAMPWLAYLIVILVALFVIYGLFSFYNFGARSLRIKLVTTFLLVSIVAVLPIVGYLNWANRDTLIERENSKLLGVAKQAANEIDQFIENTLRNLAVEASLNDFAIYIGLSPQERAIGWEPIIQDTLQRFAKRDSDNIVSYALLDSSGNVLADSSGLTVGQNFVQTAAFTEAFTKNVVFMSPVIAEQSQGGSYEYYVYFSAPVKNADDFVIGVLWVKYHAKILQEIIVSYSGQAGLTSFAMLTDEYNLRLGQGRDATQLYKFIDRVDANTAKSLQDANRVPPGSLDTLTTNLRNFDQKLRQTDTQSTFTAYISNDLSTGFGQTQKANPLMRAAVSKLENKPWKVTIFQEESITLLPLQVQARVVGWLVLGIAVVLTILSLVISTFYTTPVNRLTEAASQIAQGKLDVTVVNKGYQDEFGILSDAFNNMSRQIRQNVVTLETRVAERTRDLELRAFQLQTAAETGNIVSTIRDIKKLLPDVTELLSDRFGFYHVGIFLVDEMGEYAVLQAANSEGGRRMLEHGHRLKVGATGIVGYVTATGQPRISLDVGDDAVFFNNPDLPRTRSEMALPLVVRGKVIGALDIQSDESNAFTASDVTILRVVADQVAIAIENARLFIELEGAAEATRRAYGEVTERAWADYTGSQATRGYLVRGYRGVNDADVTLPLEEKPSDELLQNLPNLRGGSVVQITPHLLAVPIKFRSLMLGAIRLKKDESTHPWTSDEITSIQNLADQLGAALENARLYRETQRAASRDRMVREIGDRMRRSADMDSLIQTAIREMARVLDVNQAFAQINVEPGSGNGDGLDGNHHSGEMA
jgi:GAF domain-containing protein/HAMP domain-containing protein